MTRTNLMTIDAAEHLSDMELADLTFDQLAALHEECVSEARKIAAIKKRVVGAVERRMTANGEALPNTGSVTETHGDTTITVTRPKIVAWDQAKLASFEEQVREWADSPSDYIDVKRSIPEAKYQAWPRRLQEMVEGARTVKAGSTSVKFKSEN